MTIRPSIRYPSQSSIVSLLMPWGGAKNRSSLLVKDGTPLEQDWLNDIWGFVQYALTKAGITPNDVPDTAVKSQLFEALEDATDRRIANNAARNWTATYLSDLAGAVLGEADVKGIAGNDDWWCLVGGKCLDGGHIPLMAYTRNAGTPQWVHRAINELGSDQNSPEDLTWDAFNNKFILVGEKDGFGFLSTADTPDQSTWDVLLKDGTVAAPMGLRVVHTNDAGVSVAFGVSVGGIEGVRSTDAAAWSSVSLPGTGTNDEVSSIASNGSTFVVGSYYVVSGWLRLHVSIDSGATYTRVDLDSLAGPTFVGATSITWDGKNFVVLCGNGEVLVSPTGLTGSWLFRAEIPDSPAAGSCRAIKADPKTGIIQALVGIPSRLCMSTDSATTWSRVPNLPLNIDAKSGDPDWQELGFNGSAWTLAYASTSHGQGRMLDSCQSSTMPGA